jgi:hypothetical protein
MVAAVVSLGVEDADRERTWLADAADLSKRGSFACAREVAAATLAAFPGKPGVWRAAVAVEKAAAKAAEGEDAKAAVEAAAAVDALLQKAVTYCPEVSFFFSFFLFLFLAQSTQKKDPSRGLLFVIACSRTKIENAKQLRARRRGKQKSNLRFLEDRPRRKPKRGGRGGENRTASFFLPSPLSSQTCYGANKIVALFISLIEENLTKQKHTNRKNNSEKKRPRCSG